LDGDRIRSEMKIAALAAVGVDEVDAVRDSGAAVDARDRVSIGLAVVDIGDGAGSDRVDRDPFVHRAEARDGDVDAEVTVVSAASVLVVADAPSWIEVDVVRNGPLARELTDQRPLEDTLTVTSRRSRRAPRRSAGAVAA